MSDPTATTPFRVLVRDLPATRTVEVGPDYVAKVLAGLPMRDALGDVDAGHGRLDVELYPEGHNVHARGRMRGQVVVACSRCVAPARVDLDEDVHVTFMPEAAIAAMKAEETEEGVELGEADLDVFPYDGEAVDLEPLVREQLVLAVPYAPLCREECQGLCPQCGVDRNVERCTCEKPLDPRFEALKGLKLPS
jgi:uncharacterized protein